MDDLDALQAGESVGMLHVSCTELQNLLMGTLHQVNPRPPRIILNLLQSSHRNLSPWNPLE